MRLELEIERLEWQLRVWVWILKKVSVEYVVWDNVDGKILECKNWSAV